MAAVVGQEQAKRAVEIAAAGGHNVLMSGSPGSGKTMIARSIPSILPRLTLDEALEITKIYSVAGLLPADKPLMASRPYRSPHHTASGVSLVGGGAWPKPGEISLAHRGVLFLDEFPEFPRQILENLRQPLEDGVVNISRAAGSLSFPAKFILIAAMNPCPCGHFGDKDKECSCSPMKVANYQRRISGPIMDRIDLHVEVQRLDVNSLSGVPAGEPSSAIRARIESARSIQGERLGRFGLYANAEMSSMQIRKFCQLDKASADLLRLATDRLKLSARSYFRVLKVARTIADLAGEEKIEQKFIAEALQYRPRAD
jgi:magnesium chelatase family protein